MQYFLSMVFASILVTAQSCWKLAADSTLSSSSDSLTIGSIARLALSAMFIIGALLYMIAVGIYMYLLSNYDFSLIQSMTIPLSLLVSIFVAVVFFNEKLYIANYIGLFFVTVGIVLLSRR